MCRYPYTKGSNAEALRVSVNRIEAVFPNIPGGKYLKNSFVWNIVSINALWVWWKCRCNKKYEGIDYNVVDMIKMFWDNLIHTVKGEYDNIKGTTEMVHKKRRRIRQIWWQHLYGWMGHMKIVGIMCPHDGCFLRLVLY